jgi:hypothetical protein
MLLKVKSFQPCVPANLPQLEEHSMEQMQERRVPEVDLSHPTLSSDRQLLTPSLDGMSHLGRH